MSIFIWHGKDIGIQINSYNTHLPNMQTDDNLENRYTKYGFLHPISEDTTDYEALLLEQLPTTPAAYNSRKEDFSWILVDHHGKVWSTTFVKDKESTVLTHTHIPVGKIDYGIICVYGRPREQLFGFIHVNKNREALNKHIEEHKLGSCVPLTWLSVEDIVKTLHEKFPLKPTETP